MNPATGNLTCENCAGEHITTESRRNINFGNKGTPVIIMHLETMAKDTEPERRFSKIVGTGKGAKELTDI